MKKFKAISEKELQNINGGRNDFIQGIIDGLRLSRFVKRKK